MALFDLPAPLFAAVPQPAPGLTIDTESEAAVLPWVAELFGPLRGTASGAPGTLRRIGGALS